MIDADVYELVFAGGSGTPLGNQLANKIWAGPVAGGAAPPSFRSLVADDVAGLLGGGAGSDGAMGPPGMDGVDATDWFIPIVGPIGATGSAGTNGTNGSDGVPGMWGMDGEALEPWFVPGPTGATGATGATGSTGSAGSNGTNGADGAVGPWGMDGAAGDDWAIPVISNVVDATSSIQTQINTGRSYDPGSPTIATEQFLLQYRYLKLSGSERMTLTGTARAVVLDLNANDSVVLGSPKTPNMSFTVPTEYYLDVIKRLSLVNAMRACLVGTANLVMTDDFSTRSRIVLAGQGY